MFLLIYFVRSLQKRSQKGYRVEGETYASLERAREGRNQNEDWTCTRGEVVRNTLKRKYIAGILYKKHRKIQLSLENKALILE